MFIETFPKLLYINPIPAGRMGGGCSNFLLFRHMLLTLGFHNYLLSPQANWLNALFTFTRLNLYLDLFPVIWTFIALVKAFNERKHKKTFFLCYYDCLETLHENNTLPLYMVQPTDLRYSRYSTPMDSTVQYSTPRKGTV